MIKNAAFLVVLLELFSSYSALKLPTYIKACSQSDPEIDECARQHGQDAIPFFINGDKKYKIPNLNPLEITYLSVDQGTEQIGLKIEIQNAKLYGLTETKIRKLDVDLDNKRFTWFLDTPKVVLLSKYNISGRVLLLPIFGAGDANITLVNARYTYKWKYTIEKRKGEDYMVPEKGVISYDLDRAHINLENLFNGDRLLGPQMNKFLNENWKDAAKELGPSIAEALSRVIDSILKNICETVPWKDVFLP